jgi:hypothetical protein
VLTVALAAIALLATAGCIVLSRALFRSQERAIEELRTQVTERVRRTRELERMLDETRAQATPAITHPALREDTAPAQRRKYSETLEQELRAIEGAEDRLEYIETIERRLQDDPTLDQDELARELFA